MAALRRVRVMTTHHPANPARNASHAAVLALAVVLPLAGCDRVPREALTLEGPTMGTHYSVQIARVPHNLDETELAASVRARLEAVEDSMSTYRSDSELSRFNASDHVDWYAASAGLTHVIRAALAVSDASGGAFDITIGPLVNLWGFGPDSGGDTAPNSTQIATAKARVGYHHLRVRTDPPALRKDIPDLYVDLSAIAKGYGVDVLAELLEARDIRDYLVEIGGELRTRGMNPRGRPWRIGVERPGPGGRDAVLALRVSGKGVATSGDYRNYFEVDGRRYSHTIHPQTGQPVTHGLASVTVVHPEAMLADAWATALMVLGTRAGEELGAERGLAAYFIQRVPGAGFHTSATPAFAAYIDPP